MREKYIGKFMGEDLYIKTSPKVINKAEEFILEGFKRMLEIEVDPELSKLAGIKTKTVIIN